MKIYFVDDKKLEIIVIDKIYQENILINNFDQINPKETIYIPALEKGDCNREGLLNKNVFIDLNKAKCQLNFLINETIRKLIDKLMKINCDDNQKFNYLMKSW